MKSTIPFLVLITLVSCNSYPETPEEVVKKFAQLMADGECEEAMNYSTEEGKMIVQGSIDAGCDPYESVIDSVNCETQNNESSCLCYEQRQGIQFQFKYELEKINDQWKVGPTRKGDLPLDEEL